MSEWKYYVKLEENDNTVTVTKETPAGTNIEVDSDEIEVLQDIPFGHKLAIKDIEKGGNVIKYGVTIGTTNTEIKKGEHVHVHNLDEVSLKLREDLKKRMGGL